MAQKLHYTSDAVWVWPTAVGSIENIVVATAFGATSSSTLAKTSFQSQTRNNKFKEWSRMPFPSMRENWKFLRADFEAQHPSAEQC
jgi:hypothetical protein